MKYKQILFGFTVFVALFAWLQIKFQYHFYYIEQSQLFLFSPDYLGEKIMTLGGFSALLSEFLVQFFIYPYVGPVVVAALLTLVGICTAEICKQLAPQVKFFLLYLLPVIALLFMHFDFNYRVQGTVSYLLMLIALLGYLRIRQDRWRLLVGCISVPILLIAAGSVAGLFALTACFIEFLKRTPKAYLSLLMVAEVGLLGVCCVCFAWIGEFRLAFLPCRICIIIRCYIPKLRFIMLGLRCHLYYFLLMGYGINKDSRAKADGSQVRSVCCK